MERPRSMQSSLNVWLVVVALVSQNLLTPVFCAAPNFEDQKNFYTPDPHAGSPPTASHGTPTPTPYYGTPTPTHGTPSPHHGSGSTPKCEPSPPKSHTTPPTHHGGSPHTPTPSTPRGGGYTPTPTPSTPRGGGHTPTPSTPRGGGYTPNPSPPVVVTPPATPVPVPNPGTPYVPAPSTPTPTPTPTTPGAPPFLPDPNTPCTCDFWRHHPTLVWGVVGWFGLGTLGGAFGHASLPGISPSLSCLDALSNSIPNGYGALYREGTAALLNSVATNKFPFTTQDVRNHFASGLGSNQAAATQAQLFKRANEGRLKLKA